MKTYINMKECEFEVESLSNKDLWTADELLDVILKLEEKIEELKRDKTEIKDEFRVYRENSKDLIAYYKEKGVLVTITPENPNAEREITLNTAAAK